MDLTVIFILLLLFIAIIFKGGVKVPKQPKRTKKFKDWGGGFKRKW